MSLNQLTIAKTLSAANFEGKLENMTPFALRYNASKR
jgi:hypothetical protein